MSSYLWKFYLEDDVNSFRRLLAEASYVTGPYRNPFGTTANIGGLASPVGSSGAISNSKLRKSSAGYHGGKARASATGNGHWAGLTLTRADVNLKDRTGLNILHHASSSTASTAVGFATALIDHPLVDLYLQDEENGWTALHRALYFGNITIARAIMSREMRDAVGHGKTGFALHAGGIIRIKDKEGNSPFDLYNATIASRPLQHQPIRKEYLKETEEDDGSGSAEDDEDESSHEGDHTGSGVARKPKLDGDEVFTFGSNKNFNLGFGDEDDRQYPERVILTRPDHLFRRLYWKQLRRTESSIEGETETISTSFPSRVDSLPAAVRYKPMLIQDVRISKYHTAILTADLEANLYMCGYGPGGRLGTGDETTRFTFVCVEGGGLARKRVVDVGLGHNHTLATTSDGEIYSWGTNTYGQLGYTLPKPNATDEDPVQASPRQLFGPLKHEFVVATAASSIHSVVHTATALYTFGKNEGQLGLVDSDARSLEVQPIPRRIGVSLFSSAIRMVSAIDRATICLLENDEVWVFANFGYARLSFPVDGFANYFLSQTPIAFRPGGHPNRVSKISSGGDTICALCGSGDVFAVRVNQKLAPVPVETSTTNPNKIRNALSQPQRVWSYGKASMAVRDLSVGQDGSVIICTQSGSVWRRVRRAKLENVKAQSGRQSKSKDFKFSRVPGLTRVAAVRSNVTGVFAAIRKDDDIMRTQIRIGDSSLRADIKGLLSFRGLRLAEEGTGRGTNDVPGSGVSRAKVEQTLKTLGSAKLEAELVAAISQNRASIDMNYDAILRTSMAAVRIPVHRFLLARSPVLQRVLAEHGLRGRSTLPELLTIESDGSSKNEVTLQGLDLLTLFNLVLYLYTDDIVPFWLQLRRTQMHASRYRQTRLELIKTAASLELKELEAAVKAMRVPAPSMHRDLGRAISMSTFFDDADILLKVDGAEIKVHSSVMCQRCPFFTGLFRGRAAGRWLSTRQQESDQAAEPVRIDLSHVDPEVFHFILRYVYADAGEEMFDDVITTDLDEFLDVVIDVMSVANELMLERLCQVCQKVLGRFGTTCRSLAIALTRKLME